MSKTRSVRSELKEKRSSPKQDEFRWAKRNHKWVQVLKAVKDYSKGCYAQGDRQGPGASLRACKPPYRGF